MYLEGYCSVEGCNKTVVENSLTCQEPEHLAMFAKYQKRKGANFQRKAHGLKQSSKPPDTEDFDECHGGDEHGIVDMEISCPQKPESGIRRLRAHFGRLQTHSEQFMVRPCGIIVARATFFNSETVPQTVVSIAKHSVAVY